MFALVRPSVCPSVAPLKKKKMCNQLFPEFSSNRFETLYIYYKHIYVHMNFCRRKNNFWQNYGILGIDKLKVRLQHGLASLCNQLQGFSSNQFETLYLCYKHIEDVYVTFWRRENTNWQNYVIFDLDNFEVRLQYWVASLCNQLLQEFSSNQLETLHKCYKHIENVHMTFHRRKNNFWQNCGIFDLDKFKVSLQHRVASLCKQLLPGFSSNQFEPFHRCEWVVGWCDSPG